jgi:nucleoside-diphosphate-sugar epimerase
MEKILVIGACGQIGTELTIALKAKYGENQVLAADVKTLTDVPFHLRPYLRLNVMDKLELRTLIIKEKITTVYHLAATLSANGEKQPLVAWDLNMQGLLNVLDVAKSDKLKVFWPSSIAVFGPDVPKAFAPQQSITEPSTVYGISKVAGEFWCKYYHNQYGVDVRSIRYPGLISHMATPGGGTTDYAVDIFYQALKQRQYTCYIKPHTALPMMYMPDALEATLRLMDTSPDKITIRTGYNVHALSFTPEQLAAEITKHLPAFKMLYRPDTRQAIAESWPTGVNDQRARHDWGWQPRYDLSGMVNDMLENLKRKTAFS